MRSFWINSYFVVGWSILAGLVFLRSYFFAHYLLDADLGGLILLQSAALFGSFYHLGIINGGYRVISKGDESDLIWISRLNALPLYFAIITGIILLLGSLFFSFNLILALGLVVFSTLTSFSNWQQNVSIALGKRLPMVKVLLISICLSICVFFYFLDESIVAIWTSLLVYPLTASVFLVFVNYQERVFSPIRLIDLTGFKSLFKIGFYPFLVGVIMISQNHAEKWLIKSWLGVDVLGTMFIFYLFINLWKIVPKALNNIFFPSGVRYWTQGNTKMYRINSRKYLALLVTYNLLIMFFSLVLFEDILVSMFRHRDINYNFIRLCLPGFMLVSIYDYIDYTFNIKLVLRPLVVIETIAIFTYLVFLFTQKIYSVDSFLYAFLVYSSSRFICGFLALYKYRYVST